MMEIPKELRAYMATIGAKGGANGSGASKARTKTQARRAAKTRWAIARGTLPAPSKRKVRTLAQRTKWRAMLDGRARRAEELEASKYADLVARVREIA